MDKEAVMRKGGREEHGKGGEGRSEDTRTRNRT